MIPRLAPVLMTVRNSKGRIMPLHLFGPPGVGKTAITDTVARTMALMNPGAPFGLIVTNPPVLSPSDVPGVMMFGTDEKGRRNAEYTTPAIFRVTRLYYCPPAAAGSPDPDPSDPDSGATFESVIAYRAARLRIAHNPITYPRPSPNQHPHPRPLYAGDWYTDEDGETWGCVRDGLMLLDEFMQAPTDTQASLAPVLDEGRAGPHHLPPGWAVWAASNRAKDASGTKKHLAFLTNRVAAVEVQPSFHGKGGLKDYLAGRTRADVPPHDLILPGCDSYEPRESDPNAGQGPLIRRPVSEIVMSYAESNEGTLFEGVPSDPSLPFLTPRSLEMASALFDALMRDEDGEMLDSSYDGNLGGTIEERRSAFLALCGGVIGRNNAATLLGVADLWGQLPTVEQIVAAHKKHESAPVPERMDAQLLMAYRVAARMTMKNADALMDYLARLRPAFYHNAVITACCRPYDPKKPEIPPGNALLSHPKVMAYSDRYPDEFVQVMTLVTNRRR
jgi:hypothetical protein